MATPQFAIVDVSPEMTTIVGTGPVVAELLPERASAITLHLSTNPQVEVHSTCVPGRIAAGTGGAVLTLVVMRSALVRLFGWNPRPCDDGAFHLPPELVRIAKATMSEPARG